MLVGDCHGCGCLPGWTQLLQRGPELREEAVWHLPGRAQAAPEVSAHHWGGRTAIPAPLPWEQRCLAQREGGGKKASLASVGLTAPRAAGTLPEVQGLATDARVYYSASPGVPAAVGQAPGLGLQDLNGPNLEFKENLRKAI